MVTPTSHTLTISHSIYGMSVCAYVSVLLVLILYCVYVIVCIEIL